MPKPAYVLRLERTEALAAANAILPAMVQNRIGDWASTDENDDFAESIAIEYLSVLNYLMQGVSTSGAIGAAPKPPKKARVPQLLTWRRR